jgi:hypothetical protein
VLALLPVTIFSLDTAKLISTHLHTPCAEASLGVTFRLRNRSDDVLRLEHTLDAFFASQTSIAVAFKDDSTIALSIEEDEDFYSHNWTHFQLKNFTATDFRLSYHGVEYGRIPQGASFVGGKFFTSALDKLTYL